MGRGPGPTTNIAKFAVTSTNTQPGYTTDLLQGNGVHVSFNRTVPTDATTGHYGYGMETLDGVNFSLDTRPVAVDTYPNEYVPQQSGTDWPSSTLPAQASFGFTTGGNPTAITHQDASNNLQTIAWGLKGSDELSGVLNPDGCFGGIRTQIRPATTLTKQLGDLVGVNGPSQDSSLLGVALSRDELFTAVAYKDDAATTTATSLAILDPVGNLKNSNKPILDFGASYNELGNLISMSGADGDGKYYIAVAQGGAAGIGPGFNPGFDFVAIYQFDPVTNALAVVDTSNSEGIPGQPINENNALGLSSPGDIKNLRISDDGAWVMTCAPNSTITAGGTAGDGVVQLYKNPKTLNGPASSLKCVTVPCPEKNNNIGWGYLGDLATVAPSDSGDDGIVFVTQTQAGADFPAVNIRYYRFDLNTGVLDNSQPTNITLVGSPNSAPGYIPGLTTGPGGLEYFSIKSLRLNTDTSVNPDLNVLTITTDNGAFTFDIVATWLITYA